MHSNLATLKWWFSNPDVVLIDKNLAYAHKHSCSLLFSVATAKIMALHSTFQIGEHLPRKTA